MTGRIGTLELVGGEPMVKLLNAYSALWLHAMREVKIAGDIAESKRDLTVTKGQPYRIW